ncbi:hypothetical protein [Massilia sp. TWR1-2-2]|uniref:hypothetical protein n=1 Tax=Massilia sp. TWR1-2-2 TaxID=2804584 RepID=UPI003CF70D33
MTMQKIKFSALDLIDKRAVSWLADEAETLTAFVTAAAVHPGELLEAAAFMKEFLKGTAEHSALADRLRLGDTSTESILACIGRCAPTYRTLAESTDAELDELLADLKSTATAS